MLPPSHSLTRFHIFKESRYKVVRGHSRNLSRLDMAHTRAVLALVLALPAIHAFVGPALPLQQVRHVFLGERGLRSPCMRESSSRNLGKREVAHLKKKQLMYEKMIFEGFAGFKQGRPVWARPTRSSAFALQVVLVCGLVTKIPGCLSLRCSCKRLKHQPSAHHACSELFGVCICD